MKDQSQITVILTDEMITLPSFINAIESSESGALATFSGNVRVSDNGKEVARLSYEIHPTTYDVLSKVVHEVATRHEILAVAVAHRHGEIPIGESALIVAVASAHREEAFRTCAEMVDEIKSRIPIWKHQIFSDGTDEWVNCA